MQDVWIFGYGSLIWRPAFPYMERRIATLPGYARRFWQESTDHRGTPIEPGRVVTLIHDPDATVVGVAYRVGPSDHGDVIGGLDLRERQGYEKVIARASLDDGTEAEVTAYIASPDNPHYVGPEDVETIACVCASATGPSGTNAEYVTQLQSALRTLGAIDPHVEEVALALETLRRIGGTSL